MPDGTHADPRPRTTLLLAIALLMIALLPRVISLSDFYTTDEAYFWQGRVAHFSAAITMSDWRSTDQTGHPGVTTMWLGALGKYLADGLGVPAPAPGNGTRYVSYLRMPLAVMNALAVSLGYLLLRRLLRPSVAFGAALLWATSPFLIAHSRLLHLDALLTSLISLSLLSLLVATIGARAPIRPLWRRPSLLLAGVFAGLALLTKSPALLLLPFAGVLMFASEFGVRPAGVTLWRAALPALARALGAFLVWMIAATVIFVALWPAMWVSPLGALGSIITEVINNGGKAHSAGNYFMGQAVADPGWFFYVAVVLWRGEPPLTLGLLALAGCGIGWLLNRQTTTTGQALHSREPDLIRQRHVIMAMIAFSLLFLIALTQMAKKFDRYLLPLWPGLEILAAIGISAMLDWAARTVWGRAILSRRLIRPLLAGAVVVSLIVPLISYAPYYLAYYTPLLGGGTTAQEVLLAGWGEGMEQAGAWLNARPDFERGPVLSWIPETLTPFVRPTVAVYDLDTDALSKSANYAVIYTSVAARDSRTVAEAFALQTPPLFTLRVHGVTYVSIHQVPRPYSRTLDAVFSGVHLRGISDQIIGSTLVITPSWDIQLDRVGGLRSFVHVLSPEGTLVGQIDTVIDDGMFANWQVGQQFGTPLPIGLPTDLPAGEYRVLLGLYTPENGQRLPVTIGQTAPENVDGPNAVEILRIRR